MDEDGDRSIKTRLFGEDHSDGVLKQVIKARLLRELGQPTGGEDTDEQSGLGTEPRRDGLSSAPLRIDRFTILRKLGQGGMGVVYVAFDEQLDRKVAIKLLRRELTDDERGRARMSREAQALARLSHPNVVQVHEVGRWRDHHYVAMEFVAGQTLDHWLHEGPAKRPRPWREGLALLIQAGRGLAAAHARDLVHRDFKPANVMVGEDGRVRVLDFGLARSVHERGGDVGLPTADVEETLEQTGVHASETWNPTASSAFDRELTLTGAVLGTPAYMAPEQHLGQSATVLSDQFSFCVVLYEALFGVRPFAAKSRAEYTHRVIEGRFEMPGPKSGVPVWLRKAVLRGLAPSPADRWPSMNALLTELSRERGRVWRISALAAGFAAVLVTGLLLGPSEVEMCTIDDAALAGVWDEGRRSDVSDAFAASGLAHGDRTLDRVMERLDDQADQLIAARGDACRARWVTQEQTDAQLELRNACLDQRQRELDATVDTLADGDPDTLEHGVELLDGLGDVGLCEQVDLLERGWLVAKDAKTAKQVGVLRGQIAHAHALRLASDVIGARRILDAISSEAEAIDYGPLSAELLYLRGRLEQREEKFAEARESLLAAATMAEQFHHLELAVEAWSAVMMIAGGRETHEPTRSAEYRMAVMALDRLGVAPNDLRRHQLTHGLAYRLINADQPARAVAVIDESLAQLDEFGSAPEALQRMWNLRIRAEALLALAQVDAAEQSYRESWRLAAELQGETSLACADIDFNLGLLLLERESGMDEGIERIERSRATYVRVYSPTSSRIAMVDLALANHAFLTGKLDDALDLAQRALQVMPPGHEDRSWALDALAAIQMNRGDLQAAETAIDEAIATHLDEGRAQHSDLAFMRMQRGHLRVHQLRFDEALDEFTAATEIYATSLPDQHPDWIPLHMGVGEARLGLGEVEAASQQFERARSLVDEASSDHGLQAHLAWAEARALRALGRHDESRQSASTAQALLAGLHSKDPILTEIEAFLE